MTIGSILHPVEGNVRLEELIVRSLDKTHYITVCVGTRRDILRYADKHNIKIIF